MSFAHPFYTPAILALAGGCHAVVAQRVCIREIRCRSPIKLSFWRPFRSSIFRGSRSAAGCDRSSSGACAAHRRRPIPSRAKYSTWPTLAEVSAIKIPDTADTQEKGLRVAADFLSCHHWPAPTQ